VQTEALTIVLWRSEPQAVSEGSARVSGGLAPSSGVKGDGLTMTVLPAISAGASPAGEHQREVPRRDGRDRAERHAADRPVHTGLVGALRHGEVHLGEGAQPLQSALLVRAWPPRPARYRGWHRCCVLPPAMRDTRGPIHRKIFGD